jgi:hypothetical protein
MWLNGFKDKAPRTPVLVLDAPSAHVLRAQSRSWVVVCVFLPGT